MASSLKHPGEAENLAGSKTVTEPRPDQVNADAVSLDVPVKVHGARVSEASRGALPQTEPFEELTATMIVFPQGGVLRLNTTVAVGQMLVLTNMNSNQDAICRVLKVRTYSNQAGYVEFQFTHAQPNYWGVQFAPADGPAKAPAFPAPAQAAVHASAPKPSDVSAPAQTAVGSTHSATAQAAKNAAESSFISIGMKEEIEPAAAQPTRAPKLAVVRKPAPQPAVPAAPVAQETVSAPPAVAQVSEPGAPLASAPLAAQVPSSQIAGAQPAAIDTTTVPQADFGASLASRSAVESDQKTPVWLNWKLGAAAAGLAVVIGGGLFLTHARSTTPAGASTAANVSAPAQPAPAAATPVEPTAVEAPAKRVNSAPVAAPAAPAAARPQAASRVATNASAQPRPAEVASSPAEAPSQPAARRVPDVTSDLFGSLNAHPVAGSSRSASAISAPAPDAAAMASNALPIAGLNTQAPAPLPLPSGLASESIQKNITEPRLLSSVQPVYPDAARTLHTQGDVTVQTTIDANGKVTDAKAISGPFVLRQAAENAIREWKYKPGQINGKPAASSTIVVIRFHI